MPDDIARVIARILDGLRPTPQAVRGRTLQTFTGSIEQVSVADTVTTATSAVGSPRYGVARYGLVIYGQ